MNKKLLLITLLSCGTLSADEKSKREIVKDKLVHKIVVLINEHNATVSDEDDKHDPDGGFEFTDSDSPAQWCSIF